MKLNKMLVFLAIFCLLGSMAVPVRAATAITGVVEPGGDLGTYSVGSTITGHLEVRFTNATRSMSIIQMSCPESQAKYESMSARMNGVDVSGQFDVAYGGGTVLVNCTNLAPANGLLVVDLVLRVGGLEGNFTAGWRNVAVAYQAPPNPPITHDHQGTSKFEVIYGVKVSFFNGWNLLGVPVNLREPTVSGAFGSDLSRVEYLYGFDNEAKEFRFWIKGLPDAVQTVKSFEAGKGYWVYTNDDFDLNLLFRGLGQPPQQPTGKSPLDGRVIKIGYIASSTVGLETAQPLIKQIIEPDLNDYARKLGYDVTFEFLIDDATGLANVHLEKVQAFHAMGVNLIIGGGWSSQASGSLGYCNENDMLMFSWSSTSPLLAIPNDNLFRMAPNDLKQAPAIAEMLWSYGIKAVVVIQRGDSWADGLYNAFKPLFEAKGGVILDRIRYAAEVQEFSSYLASMESTLAAAKATYGADRIAVEMISFQEGVIIVNQAQTYPTLYSVPWFGSDGTSMTQQFIDDTPVESKHLHIFSTLAAAPQSQKYKDLYDRYYALTSQPLGFYNAGLYDTAWVIAKGVLEAQSTQAHDVIPLIPQICYDMWGASGWCRLDQNGDRYDANYDIWGYGGTPVQNVHYGYYDGVTGKVTWDTTALGYTPLGP